VSLIISPDDYDSVCTMLAAGCVGVLHTDTVYGLVCSAQLPTAVARLYRLKRRGRKPGTLTAAQLKDLVALGFDQHDLATAQQFWPGAVSVVLPVPEKRAYLSPGQPDIAVRLATPGNYTHLLTQSGPLLTTSANLPGEPPARNLQEAQAYFGDTVDFYVDDGEVGDVLPSTIVKITDSGFTVLRQGAATIDTNERD